MFVRLPDELALLVCLSFRVFDCRSLCVCLVWSVQDYKVECLSRSGLRGLEELRYLV